MNCIEELNKTPGNYKDKVGDLCKKYYLKSTFHPTLPLVALNYHQNLSPDHPIAHECRGLVLDYSDFSVAARPFGRFFNYWQNRPEFTDFFANQPVIGQDKIDGSLMILYCCRDNWMVNTRNTFCDGKINDYKTWSELFFESFNKENFKILNPHYTYLFELQSPYNQIIQYEPNPKLTFLAAIENITGEEKCAHLIGVDRPKQYLFKDLDIVMETLARKVGGRADFEGFVLKNSAGVRMKVKSQKYLGLHKIFTNRQDTIDSFVDLVIKGMDRDEILQVCPKYEDVLDKIIAAAQKIDLRRIELTEIARRQNSPREAYEKIGSSPLAGLVMADLKYPSDNPFAKNPRLFKKLILEDL